MLFRLILLVTPARHAALTGVAQGADKFKLQLLLGGDERK